MSGYIGTQPVPQATQTRDTFTATASQTSFATAGYTPGFIDVYLNGVHLQNGTDFTATNGSDVVLTTGAALNDVLEVVAYSTFDSANTYNRTEADAEFVQVAGDTMTGALTVNGTVTANQFVGSGAIILVGDQSDTTAYTTTSTSYQTATRFQITPSTSTSQLLGWFYCQMNATSTDADGDLGNTARVDNLNASSAWAARSSLAQNLRTENGTSTGIQEIAVTFPVLLTQSQLNPSGKWDVAVRHYSLYAATSEIDDGRFHYMEYEP